MKRVTVFTASGKSSHWSKQQYLSLLSQCMIDSRGQFQQIQHVKQEYHSLLSAMYICQLIKEYVPFNVPCDSTMSHLIVATDLLNRGQYKLAWQGFELYLSQASRIEDSLGYLKLQYQQVPSLHLRQILSS